MTCLTLNSQYRIKSFICCSAELASVHGPAAVRMALDMLKEKLITKEEAVIRVKPEQLDELLHPIIDPESRIGYKAYS